MPHITPRTYEVGDHFCRRLSGSRPSISAVPVDQPATIWRGERFVHVMFRPLVAIAGAFMLMFQCAYSINAVRHSDEYACIAFEAPIGQLVDMASAVSPRLDPRRTGVPLTWVI